MLTVRLRSAAAASSQTTTVPHQDSVLHPSTTDPPQRTSAGGPLTAGPEVGGVQGGQERGQHRPLRCSCLTHQHHPDVRQLDEKVLHPPGLLGGTGDQEEVFTWWTPSPGPGSALRMEVMVSVCQESHSHQNVAVFSSAALLLNYCSIL